jgi:membrane-associated phospholipid phosphatase
MRRFGVVVLAFAFGLPAGFVRADEGPMGPPAPREPVAIAQLEHAKEDRRTLGRLPANLGGAALGMWSKPSVVPLLAGSALAGVASAFDQRTAHPGGPGEGGVEKFSETGATLGGGAVVGAAAVGVFVGGRLAHGERFRAFSYDLFEATLVNAAYTDVLKVAVRRERPDGSDNKSFPSGHTSNAFTWATLVERHYGWKAAIPAYAVAAAIGASRVTQGAHYLSDVVAGATLGVIVGRTVARLNGGAAGTRAAGARKHLAVSPILGSHRTYGLAVALDFN